MCLFSRDCLYFQLLLCQLHDKQWIELLQIPFCGQNIMTEKQLQSKEQELLLASIPDKHEVQDKYKKAQLFTFISNKNLSNFVCMPICGIFWVGGFIYANQNKISPIQVNLTRYIAQIISIFFIVKLRSESIEFKNKKDFRMLMVRSFISGINGMVAAFFQMFLPLTVYYTISASIIIFTFILNYFLYGVHVSANQLKAVAAAFIGIVLVINGRAIYQLVDSSYEFTSKFDYSSTELWVQILMGMLVVLWNCVWAYAIVITGKHHATFHQFIVINSMAGFFMFSVLQQMLPEASPNSLTSLFVRKPDRYFETLLFCGVAQATANYIFNLALFISANAGVSTIINQINILYVYLISTLRYDEEINYVCLLGGVILISGIYVTLFKK